MTRKKDHLEKYMDLRFLRAVELLAKGHSRKEVAEILGIHRSTL